MSRFVFRLPSRLVVPTLVAGALAVATIAAGPAAAGANFKGLFYGRTNFQRAVDPVLATAMVLLAALVVIWPDSTGARVRNNGTSGVRARKLRDRVRRNYSGESAPATDSLSSARVQDAP
jgi:hypothetical protein